MVEEPERDLLARIRSIASSLSEDGSHGLVDAAARSLAGTLERWGHSARLEWLVGGVRHDILTGAGERVDVGATLGVTGRLGTHARFLVGDRVVAEVEIGGDEEVFTEITAPGPGRHALRVEIRGADGTAVPAHTGQRLLQVVDGRPVALVDAELLLPADDGLPTSEATAAALHELDGAFELAYFDIHEEDRHARIREALAERGLPRGAILVHSAKDSDLHALGPEFVEVLAAAALRMLKARGVPVTRVLTRRYGPTERSREEGVRILDPSEPDEPAEEDTRESETACAARMLAAKAAADPLDWRLDQTTASRRVEGNAFVAELDNRVARERLFDAIASAERTIHVQLYMVRPSAFTDHFVVRLIQSARAGVRVRFMVDALYSDQDVLGRMNDAVRSLAAEPNVEVLAVEPIETREHVTLFRLKRRDHRKLLVVDGRRAFVSGRNAADEYYTGFDEVPIHDHTQHERIPWLDAHVEVRGPLVREVQEAFRKTWERQGGGAIPDDEGSFPALEPAGEGVGRLVLHRGVADTHGLAMYEALFDAAEDHVLIVNDFPFVARIERVLRRLLARGVRVCLLTGNAAPRRADGTFFPAPIHRTLFEYMVKAKLEPLLEAGVEAYEVVPPPSERVVARGGVIRPYVHAKIVSVDGRLTSIGSANLDATASYWESEANVLVQDPALARDVEAKLARLIEGSVRLDPASEYWRRERAQRAVVATLWPGALYS